MNAVLALVLILTALAAATAAPSAERTQGDLRLHLSVSKAAFQVGESVPIRLQVTNVAKAPAILTAYSGQQYDVLVRQRGALIWQWSHDKAFVQVVRESTMAPGETLTYSWTWDQRDLQGRQIEAGAYEISAVFMGAQRAGPRSVEAGPVQISIGR